MPRISVSIVLPYPLRLFKGDYSTSAVGHAVEISAAAATADGIQTVVSAVFDHDDQPNSDAMQKLRVADADDLLRRTNRLLRWYRSVRPGTEVTELTRAQASPFRFALIGVGIAAGWTDPIEYEEMGPTPVSVSTTEVTDKVRKGLASGGDPDVGILFLLDAERALQQGRFREAVLFCWSTIDSVFNRKYDQFVDAALAEEWASGREFLKGMDMGLRNKMSAGMHLVAGRSLFNEPGKLWETMSKSYTKRNSIIHRGENATEDEAEEAISVAKRIVSIMDELAIPAKA